MYRIHHNHLRPHKSSFGFSNSISLTEYSDFMNRNHMMASVSPDYSPPAPPLHPETPLPSPPLTPLPSKSPPPPRTPDAPPPSVSPPPPPDAPPPSSPPPPPSPEDSPPPPATPLQPGPKTPPPPPEVKSPPPPPPNRAPPPPGTPVTHSPPPPLTPHHVVRSPPPPPHSPPSNGLSSSISTTAIIGIAVGGVVLLVVLCLLCICCKKKKKRIRREPSDYYYPPPQPVKSEFGCFPFCILMLSHFSHQVRMIDTILFCSQWCIVCNLVIVFIVYLCFGDRDRWKLWCPASTLAAECGASCGAWNYDAVETIPYSSGVPVSSFSHTSIQASPSPSFYQQ